MLLFTSCTATTSKREMISLMHRSACRSRRGLSFGPDAHFFVTFPKPRIFQLAMRRFLSSCLAGILPSSSARSRASSALIDRGGGSVI